MDLIHTCLNVANVERSVEFYTTQLGFEESWSFTTADGKTENRYVAADNGVELQLSQSEGEVDFEDGTLWDHIAVRVSSVDEAFERINHFGVVKAPGDQPEAGARTAFIKDPDGHIVELVEALD
ncbi:MULTISPECIES: VOC family protein [unclassified Haladaptatus]|uniref:VOC family protein n=1 Tax=unclassified Haladaptatus TaxID=2622732 RepID=UPI0023E837C3|nr:MULTISPECIES: VOC family protein [unclassified Haladaptatus]